MRAARPAPPYGRARGAGSPSEGGSACAPVVSSKEPRARAGLTAGREGTGPEGTGPEGTGRGVKRSLGGVSPRVRCTAPPFPSVASPGLREAVVGTEGKRGGGPEQGGREAEGRVGGRWWVRAARLGEGPGRSPAAAAEPRVSF